MIPTQTLESYPLFGACATKIQPGDVKRENGFIEGDVYPAEWVNWKWAKDSKGIADANTGLCSIEQEINNVLTCAGITPNLSCTDQLYNAMICKIQDCVGTAAPKAHASAETIYGVGTADCYGHLKISDTYTSVLAACTGVAASQLAVACVYSVANGKAAVGNTAGCELGTAAAGTATTAARSDHVHPKPTQVDCAKAICRCTARDGTCHVALAGGNTAIANAYFHVSNCCPLTYAPATGALIACCMLANVFQIGCTFYTNGYAELYHATPFIDFHHACAIADYSARLINNAAGFFCIAVNNATAGTAATQSSSFLFSSAGVITANCFCGTAEKAAKLKLTSTPPACGTPVIQFMKSGNTYCMYAYSLGGCNSYYLTAET